MFTRSKQARRSFTSLQTLNTHTHTSLSRTALSSNLACTISFLFPAFPISFSHLRDCYWKQLTCWVFLSFIFFVLLLVLFFVVLFLLLLPWSCSCFRRNCCCCGCCLIHVVTDVPLVLQVAFVVPGRPCKVARCHRETSAPPEPA